MENNIKKIKLDPFTLNIDIAGNQEMTTIKIMNILLQTDCKIHIINYSSFNIEDYISSKIKVDGNDFLKSKYRNIIFVNETKVSRTWLDNYTKKCGNNDFIFINDIRRLIRQPKNKENFLTTTIGSQITTVHFESEENWEELVCFLDLYYKTYQEKVYGIFSVIYTDINGYNCIKEHLENVDSMSIISTSYNTDNSDVFNLDEIKSAIITLPLNEALKKIEQMKEKISDESYKHLISIAYFYGGDISNASKELEMIEKKLSDQNLVSLSDMLLRRGTSEDIAKAESLLLKVYKNNKTVKNLFPTFFRLYRNNKSKLHEFVLEALKYDPDDLAVIEMNGSRLASIGQHLEAAKEFRRLANYENFPYYELVARINEIIADNKLEDKNKVSHIEEHIKQYPHLRNEAMLRLASYFIKYKQSYFRAYECLSKADINLESLKQQEIMLLKIKILKDENNASKALMKLKPYKKIEDAQQLNRERYKALIESIKVFSLDSKGYLYWRDFIECQSSKSWSENIYPFIKESIDKFIELDIKKLIESSFIYKAENIEIVENMELIEENYESLNANVIKIVRRVFSDKKYDKIFTDFEELFKTILTIPRITNDQIAEIWGMYYLSLIASMRGKGQRANEIALTIFDFVSRVKQETQKLCQCLGLIAWGNTQYRAGRKVEGISCVMVAMQLSIDIKEPYAIIELGLNIIGRFLADECSNDMQREIEYWRKVNDKIDRKNAVFDYLCVVDEEILLKKVEKCENKDSEWAGNLVNLISRYSNKKQFDKAYLLLEKYSEEAIDYLSNRKDVLFHILYNWANVYLYSIKNGSINNLFKALELSQKAIHELEEFRYSYSHKEERASLGDITLEIYKNHIAILGLLYEEQRNIESGLYYKKQIFSIIHNVLPRTLIEQRKYHLEFEITDEVKELQSQYEKSKLEYDEMTRKRLNDENSMSLKAKHIISLDKKLKENHPYYKSLEKSNPINFDELSSNLAENELCFQYVITFLGVLIILIEKNNIELYFDICDTFELQKNIDEFSYLIQHDGAKEKLEELSISISKVIFKRLTHKITQRTNIKLYCVSNFDGKLFPFVAFKEDEDYILHKISSIINIVDYSVLDYKQNNYKVNGVFNKIIGKKEDSQIEEWIKWLENIKSDNFVVDRQDSDDLSKLSETNDLFNTVAIYGHGISDPNESHLYGAKGIEGQRSIISFEDISKYIIKYDNLIIISCRGGVPDYDGFENFYGLWSSVLERFRGTILLCKWDVSTKETIEIINNIIYKCITENSSIDEALLATQKEMSKNKSVQFWGGIEFWIN